MKTQRMLLIAKPWLVVAMILALLPCGGIVWSAAMIDQQVMGAAQPKGAYIDAQAKDGQAAPMFPVDT